MAKKPIPPIKGSILESISKVVADTSTGLTGSEIGKYLNECRIPDPNPDLTKWRRLYYAFASVQNIKQNSNDILAFIQKSLHPSRFINRKENFEHIRSELNKVISFIGLAYKSDGKFGLTKKSNTISEAQKRATSLLTKLEDRNVHPDILIFCKEELLVDNYFHAVFESTKSVANKIRNLTGLSEDGSVLIDKAFSIGAPKIQINSLSNETERSEHKGFANLIKGFFGMFRNTTAHSPRILWTINEDDALDIMTFGSLFHRRLDRAIIN